MSDSGLMQFQEEAKNALAFLESKYGFQLASEAGNEVCFQTDKVYIEMIHGYHDGEVYIDFGRLIPKERFSFTLFLRSTNPRLEESLGDRMPQTPEDLKATVWSLAEALRSEGQGIVAGVDEVFEKMKGVFFWQFCPEILQSPENRATG